MKLAKLSLAAIAAVGLTTSAFAADTLADAFKNGKVKGEIKAYYFDEDSSNKDADIATFGLMLNYVTDSFSGFKMGATFQSSSSPFADVDGKDKFKGDMWGSGSVLSEAYLAYTMDKTTVKVGRQFISTPLVAGSGSRLIKQSFEGAVLVNTNIPDTTLIAGYVGKFQDRTDKAGDIGDFEKFNEDGAYTLAAINQSFPGLTITAQYADVIDEVSLMYLEAEYAGKANDFTYSISGQYNDTNYDANAVKDSGYYGLKVGMGFAGLNAYVAYTKIDDDNDAMHGLGDGPKGTIYTATIINSGYFKADAEAYAIDANYKFGSAKLGARYVTIDTGTAKVDEDRYNVYGSYAFEGALKGFGVDAIYESKETDTKPDADELWVKATYKF